MTFYRLYRLNERGAVSGAPVELDCPSDEDALARGREELDGRPGELWQEARLVARFQSAQGSC